MARNYKSILPSAADSTSSKTRARLAKKRESHDFREELVQVRKRIGAGQSLHEVREVMDIRSDVHWQDLVTSLAISFANPENILLEWQVRQHTRYQMSAKLMKMADDNPNQDDRFNQLSQAIMIASKIDQNTLELQKALGLLKPIQDIDDNGEGITSEDLEIAEQRFNQIVQERIEHKLTVKRETQSADSVDVFSRLELGGEEDRVEQPALDQNTIDG